MQSLTKALPGFLSLEVIYGLAQQALPINLRKCAPSLVLGAVLEAAELLAGGLFFPAACLEPELVIPGF